MFLSAIGERVAVDAIRLAPKQLYSNAVGWAARRRVPASVRSAAYATWARAFGARLDEVELPLDSYPSFGSFFVRGLKTGARPVDGSEETVVSPCDGRVLAAGQIDDGLLVSAKGRNYSLRALLADTELAQSLDGGCYATIYLSPRDYHRVHSPLDATIRSYAHIPGALWPVSPFFVERVDSLLARNERMVLELTAEFGRFAVVMVAATGVGNMTLARPRLESRHLRNCRDIRRVVLDEPLRCERGDELGAFELGSTVVVALPASARARVSPDVGEAVRFGQPLFVTTGEGNAG